MWVNFHPSDSFHRILRADPSRVILFVLKQVLLDVIDIVIISIPVILQVASLLAALAHPGHIVCYAPGDSLPCRRDAS
ncbi:hypothetical protein CKY12_09225 [Photorhabdus sp. S12-55]|nr:hypothetical protein PluDJC_15360 [Photorhabdus laumondii subsp. laumondii]RAW68033.1 hypothetical protein CKY15_17830 [Photorhabdus sp. S7-51]RAW69383.1 hypothetical protein CKY14_17055 [Photorhabdus sp. S14-60]RAW75520.1 hypothetical protein CKY06_17070 [Photorhabdus sp. S15-56]RAW85897.1 hypothetical protein CKY09_09855 [Photorhabdus sp. S5P8-50]RAW86075.1 hypothetical protein CKY12_09225 [Photorhabdus sp. S12-55]